jgi:hypothetical protein
MVQRGVRHARGNVEAVVAYPTKKFQARTPACASTRPVRGAESGSGLRSPKCAPSREYRDRMAGRRASMSCWGSSASTRRRPGERNIFSSSPGERRPPAGAASDNLRGSERHRGSPKDHDASHRRRLQPDKDAGDDASQAAGTTGISAANRSPGKVGQPVEPPGGRRDGPRPRSTAIIRTLLACTRPFRAASYAAGRA